MKQTLNDKIRGAMFGVALGDALGLGSEFMTLQEVKHYYPEGLRHFSQIIRDAHRCMWQQGEWSNDTQLDLLLAESIVDCGKLDVCDYARRIKEWFEENPTDMIDIYRWLLRNPEWLEQPLKETHDLWIDRHIDRASNEALPRAIVTGILGGPRLMRNTLDAISVTHDDSRCTACGIIIATMADSLLRNNEPASIDELEKLCNTLDPRTRDYLYMAYSGSLEDIDIDNPNELWHSRKTMAAGLWPIWHCNSAEETLYKIVDAGGDADTNAAVAMGLAGIRYGYDSLPEEVNNLPNYDVIEKVANRFAAFITKEH